MSCKYNEYTVDITTGSEGPTHDPYHYEEVSVTRKNKTVTIHSGLADWVTVNDKTVAEHNPRECMAKFIDLTGHDPEYWKSWPDMVEHVKFLDSLSELDRVLICIEDLEKMAKEIVESKGYPPEYYDYPEETHTHWPRSAHMITCEESAGLARCRKEDHAFVSDDYASPDSGYMGGHCIRCGYSFGCHLY